MSSSPRRTDGIGVIDKGGVKVGETGMDWQVGTLRKIFLFEIAPDLSSSSCSKVVDPELRQSDSSSAMGWKRNSLEWPFIVPREGGFNPRQNSKFQ